MRPDQSHYALDSTIVSHGAVPNAWLKMGGPLQTVCVWPGDHILDPFPDEAPPQQAQRAVMCEITDERMWRPGVLQRLPQGLGAN